MVEEKVIIGSIFGNKINIINCLDSQYIDLSSMNMSINQLSKVNKCILRYYNWFKIKNISSLQVSLKKKNDILFIKWLFNNTRNDICIYRCITKYLNLDLKNYGAYISSNQKNNRGYFLLTFL